MIKVQSGNLLLSNAQTLVNTVNCVGVMGKGIALEFKHRFPDMYDDYVERCDHGEVQLGKPYLYKRVVPPWILNFPTKDHWRGASRLEDIVSGLDYLSRHYQEWGITSLAVPPLGCGFGQLEWKVVGPTLYRELKNLIIPVDLYAPMGTPAEQLADSFLLQGREKGQSTELKVKPGWVAIVASLVVLEKSGGGRVSPTMLDKLAYFLTECGVPTELKYSRGISGPFARDLKSIIRKLVNNGVLDEERAGRGVYLHPGPTYRDAAKAFSAELAPWKQTIFRVARFVANFDVADAEIAAALLFASKHLCHEHGTRFPDAVTDCVLRWRKARNRSLASSAVHQVASELVRDGWIHVS